jgi:hypothetical protein
MDCVSYLQKLLDANRAIAQGVRPAQKRAQRERKERGGVAPHVHDVCGRQQKSPAHCRCLCRHPGVQYTHTHIHNIHISNPLPCAERMRLKNAQAWPCLDAELSQAVEKLKADTVLLLSPDAQEPITEILPGE